MRQNLLETYKGQLRVAEAYVAKNFNGKAVSNQTKLATAVLLDNTNRWITESINESIATTRGDLGAWKRFCLNLTNIAVPSLIANDLVIVHPMTSYSGSVAYLKYVSKTTKGGVNVGDEFNSVFGLGDMTDARKNFTSQVIVEAVTLGTTSVTTGMDIVSGGIKYEDNMAIESADVKCIADDGTVSYATKTSDTTVTVPATTVKIAYVGKTFQMEQVPAEDIPTIGPKMEHIALVAEPRRIAVKYDQITAFQAKTDYGFSLDKQIAEQACGELAYEIDTDILDMLREGAGAPLAELTWSKTLPVGVSKFEHYNGFLETFEAAKTIIYNRTKKYHPNYMVIAADVLQVLRFVNGFNYSKSAKMNGPYKVGEIDGVNVYVSPRLNPGEFFFGLNSNDMMSSAGVYAPYMAIVPTMLLGTPDGGLAQGFSTWYAKALLNANLLVAGKITA
jgi:hypothetical protein